MSPNIAQACMQLLARVEIKGQEAPAFMKIMQELEADAKAPQAVPNLTDLTTQELG
jgi:hypothetical protein